MWTYAQFLQDAAQKGETVNTVFEERLFDLVGVMHRVADTLSDGDIPYEVIGGMAVLIHVEEASPEHSSLTRDVDLLVRRADLGRIQEAAAKGGFRFRHAAGVDMLVYKDASTKNAVHLVFSEEKVRPHYSLPSPAIAPELKQIHGKDVLVIPVAGLLQMKLTSFRLKDQVHVQSMDAAGLITPEVEAKLTPELAARLKRVRETE